MDESKKKAHIREKGAVIGGCYRIGKSSEYAASQELLIQVVGRQIAEMILYLTTIEDDIVRLFKLYRGNFKE